MDIMVLVIDITKGLWDCNLPSLLYMCCLVAVGEHDCIREILHAGAGIQVQTAECLVVGEITTSQMLVVLNKVDLLDESKRVRAIRKAKKHLAHTFKLTKFSSCKMIPVSVKYDGALAGA